MSIFSHDSYTSYLQEKLQSLPKGGHGELKRWADLLRISPTLMTQIMAGTRLLIPDHAYDFKNHFGWSELETDYFILLIQIARSQKDSFKKYLEQKRNELKEKSQSLSTRLNFDRSMNETEQATFYSSWLYSAIRMFCSTEEKGKTLTEISQEFHISPSLAQKHVSFLVSVGLCTSQDERFMMGEQRTHLKNDSPNIIKHHTNWRLKSIQNLEYLSNEELAFTGPLSLSEEDFQKLREKMIQLIKETYEIVAKSPAEKVGCLNLDLFYVTGKVKDDK